MYDKFNRKINYLRISVTDRCNLRCAYCMPEAGINLLNHNDILSFEEITVVVKKAVEFGVNKIRITGGEPLVRKGIVELISILKSIHGVDDLSMTTNGSLLEKQAQSLADAGLNRINISLDTIDPEKYREITRGGDLNRVFKGIEAAKKAGLKPIKINSVKMASSNGKTAEEMRAFCKKNDLQIRFIHQMNLNTGEFSIVEGGNGGDCKQCNRLRLTANGMIKPCLFSELEYSVRTLGPGEAIKAALNNKPKEGTYNCSGSFYNIGG